MLAAARTYSSSRQTLCVPRRRRRAAARAAEARARRTAAQRPHAGRCAGTVDLPIFSEAAWDLALGGLEHWAPFASCVPRGRGWRGPSSGTSAEARGHRASEKHPCALTSPAASSQRASSIAAIAPAARIPREPRKERAAARITRDQRATSRRPVPGSRADREGGARIRNGDRGRAGSERGGGADRGRVRAPLDRARRTTRRQPIEKVLRLLGPPARSSAAA